MTPEAFLDWEERQERPWEFDGLRPVAMNGGSAAHRRISDNLVAALRTRLRGKPCRTFSNLKVSTVGGAYRVDGLGFGVLHPNLPSVTHRPWGAYEFAALVRSGVCVVFRQWP